MTGLIPARPRFNVDGKLSSHSSHSAAQFSLHTGPRLACQSAFDWDSDSVLMQLQIRMALFWRESAPCNRHFATPVWYRPGLL